MRGLLLSAVLILTGCGAQEQIEHNKTLKLNEFNHYVSLFQEQAREQGQKIIISDLIIRFKYIPEQPDKVILGQCWRGGGMTPTIDIDPAHWNELSMTERQVLVFHEMGHCILRRDHVQGYTSIMLPYLLSNQIFMDNEPRLLAELFDTSKYGSLALHGEEDGSDDNTNHPTCGGLHSGSGGWDVHHVEQ